MSFDILAPHYRWMEFVTAGEKLQRCRTAFLQEVVTAKRAVVFGVGRGRFLPEFLRANREAEVLCLDASSRMLELTGRRLNDLGLPVNRVRFERQDILKWSGPRETYDLVVTHFFLDCFRADQLSRVIAEISLSAKRRAKWLLADFQVPSSAWLGLRARLILKVMYLFFRAAAKLPADHLTSPDHWISKNGFSLVERRTAELGLLHSDLWERSN